MMLKIRLSILVYINLLSILVDIESKDVLRENVNGSFVHFSLHILQGKCKAVQTL